MASERNQGHLDCLPGEKRKYFSCLHQPVRKKQWLQMQWIQTRFIFGQNFACTQRPGNFYSEPSISKYIWLEFSSEIAWDLLELKGTHLKLISQISSFTEY